MRIGVPFLRVMLFWYYGSELAAADTSRPEGHHANPILDLYIKCLDPADNMNVIITNISESYYGSYVVAHTHRCILPYGQATSRWALQGRFH